DVVLVHRLEPRTLLPRTGDEVVVDHEAVAQLTQPHRSREAVHRHDQILVEPDVGPLPVVRPREPPPRLVGPPRPPPPPAAARPASAAGGARSPRSAAGAGSSTGREARPRGRRPR